MNTDKLRRAAAGGQGVAGALCLTAGAGLVAGPGVALLVLGCLFLVGAWGSR